MAMVYNVHSPYSISPSLPLHLLPPSISLSPSLHLLPPSLTTHPSHRCVEEGKLLESDQFVVVGKTAAEQFSSGKVVGESCTLPLAVAVYV